MKNIFKNIKNWNASLKLGSVIALGGVILVGSSIIYSTSNSQNTTSSLIDISNSTNSGYENDTSHPYYSEPPVVQTVEEIIRPYNVNCEVAHYFYDEEDDASIREKAIVTVPGANRTYMLSEGCDYTYQNNSFEVIAVVTGTIVEKMNDEVYGNIVILEHENGTKFIYSSLSEVNVNKGELITQGKKIGISGNSLYTETIGNSLHFEVVKDNINLNPEKIYTKSIENL